MVSDKDGKRKWGWIAEFQAARDWLAAVKAERTGSERTQGVYMRQLGMLCLWAKMNPDELVAEAGRQEAAGNKKWAEKKTIEFFNWLVDKMEYKRTSANTLYGAARSFFRHHDALFFRKTPQAVTRTKIKLPFKEDLLKVWKAADLHEKQVLSILRSAFRPGDSTTLVYGDIKDDYEKGADRLYIEKVSEKEDLWFGVFLTKEATEIIRLVLEQRKAAGEVFTDNTPLISHQRDLGESVSEDMIWRIVNGAGKRVGVKLMPKMFRKWFRTYGSPVIGRDAICKMGAWTLPGVGKRYFLPPKEECLKNFLKIEDMLLFEEEKGKSDITAQRKIAYDMLKAAGFDPDILLKKAKVKTVEEEAKFLTKEVGRLLRMKVEPASGGLPFELTARKALAEILIGAIKDAKRELSEKG